MLPGAAAGLWPGKYGGSDVHTGHTGTAQIYACGTLPLPGVPAVDSDSVPVAQTPPRVRSAMEELGDGHADCPRDTQERFQRRVGLAAFDLLVEASVHRGCQEDLLLREAPVCARVPDAPADAAAFAQ